VHRIEQDEVEELKEFIDMLNHESSNGAVVVVEGKKDVIALTALGFYGNIIMLNSCRSLSRLVDNIQHSKEVILLLDMDSKGRYLTQRIVSMISNRRRVNLFYKKRLVEITRGKIRSVEELVIYKEHINNNNNRLYTI
jgi:5S rRNA maturation endonuclease (ribonuclease M5)